MNISQNLALARKYRPQSFTEVVGQEPVVTALTNAFKLGRFHHAYCFVGTRGVGKTSLARILAKAFSCEAGESATPCGTCTTCVEIDQGRYVDLIEVDAASRTKVDDTRALLDNVQYAPTRGRYKIYLIDEVHMLSTHSFNALLKTLEEPPAHVKFFLATTEVQKLPPTVLSRCLSFYLKTIPTPAIAGYLEKLCAQESIKFEQSALNQLAAAGHGSMRDTLSLLDQAIAYCDGDLTQTAISNLLGHIPKDEIYTFITALSNQDAQTIASRLDSLQHQAADFKNVCDQILAVLHQFALAKHVHNLSTDLFPDMQEITAALPDLGADAALRLYTQLCAGKPQIDLAPSPRAGLEMLCLSVMVAPQEAIVEPPAPQPVQAAQPKPAAKPPWSVSETKQAPAQQVAPSQPTPSPQTSAPQTPQVQAQRATPITLDALTPDTWANLVNQLHLTGLSRALATHSVFVELKDNTLMLELDQAQKPLMNERIQGRIEDALTKYFGMPLRVNLGTVESGTPLPTPAKQTADQKQARFEQAKTSLETDSTPQKLNEHFGAKLITETVIPAE